jgi:tartrate-resistant acid phosphatase type 5
MRCFRRVVLAQIVIFIALLIRPAAGQTFNLIGFGDWGLDSPDRQQVANAMAAYADKSPEPINCALSLGDNFYVPLHSADDPQFIKLFEQTYDPRRLNFPFYAVPGNHDYDTLDGHVKLEWEMLYAATHPNSRWKFPAKWYRLDLPADHPLLTILMLDSDKENDKQPSMSPAEWQSELKWLDQQLSSPRAAWTMCCAHHTVYSNGDHGDNGVLVTQWGTLFEKYKVDFYLCGHDHSLQHLEPGTYTSYVVSGGGGAKRKAMLRDNRGPFSRSVTGFAAFSFGPDQTTVRLLGADGSVLHAFVRTKAGAVTITQNTRSEPKTTQPLRLIEGYDVPPTPVPATQPTK